MPATSYYDAAGIFILVLFLLMSDFRFFPSKYDAMLVLSNSR